MWMRVKCGGYRRKSARKKVVGLRAWNWSMSRRPGVTYIKWRSLALWATTVKSGGATASVVARVAF